MGDPFRPPLWRRASVAVVAALLGIAALFALIQNQSANQAEALRATTPKIVSATYLGTGVITERRFQTRDNTAVFVRMADGSQRMIPYSGPGKWLEGCEIGEPIVLEQRGLVISIARKPCPEPIENAGERAGG